MKNSLTLTLDHSKNSEFSEYTENNSPANLFLNKSLEINKSYP